MAERRRRFSDEFKREAVRLAFQSGRRVTELACEFEVVTTANPVQRKLLKALSFTLPTPVQRMSLNPSAA